MGVLAIYVCSGTAAAAAAGVGAGLLGSVLAESVVAVVGTLFGACAAVVGVAELCGWRRPPIQRDRETPKEWVARGPVLWPILNGGTLGFGATTRLGFWLWYLIPIGCLLMANPVAGAVIWGTYGFTRTLGAGGILLLVAMRPNLETTTLLNQRQHATTAASALLCIIGLACFFLMGL